MKNEILNLNTGNQGSFGEFLFEAVSKNTGKEVVRVHKNDTDFEIDGVAIDVKTTYKYRTQKWRPNKFHYGTPTSSGIKRVNIIMYDDLVSINYDDDLIAKLAWDEVIKLYPMWLSQKNSGFATKRKPRNDRKIHWNKLEIAIFHNQYIVDKNFVKKDENGNWIWTIDGEEREKAIRESCKAVINKFGYEVAPAMVVFGRKNSKIWNDNKIEDKVMLGTGRPDINNLVGVASKYITGIWTEQKSLNFATHLIGRPIKDINSIVKAVRLYFENPRGKYKVKEILNMCV